MKNLGNVVGLIKDVDPPVKTYVIWARVLDANAPDVVKLYYYDNISGLWEPFDAAKGFWLPPVASFGANVSPGSPAVGDRHIVGTAPTGSWTGKNNQYAEWTGQAWLFHPVKKGTIAFDLNVQNTMYQYSGTAWNTLTLGSNGEVSLAFNGNRAITRNISGLSGVNPGGTTVTEFLEKTFYPSVPPTISMSGSENRQFGNNTDLHITWTVTKRDKGITTINISGTPVTPSTGIDQDSDASGNTQTGSKVQPITPNTNGNFVGTVTSNTGETATAAIAVAFYHQRYWGKIAKSGLVGQEITDDDIKALDGAGSGSGKELSTTRVQTRNAMNGAGLYLAFAWPTSFGTPSFVVNGLSNNAWTKVRSNTDFVNSDAFTTKYDVWVSNTIQNSPANIQVN